MWQGGAVCGDPVSSLPFPLSGSVVGKNVQVLGSLSAFPEDVLILEQLK